MDDIASKITELLKDPDGMKKIQSIASGIMSDSAQSESKDPTASHLSESALDPEQMGNIMKIMSLLKKDNKDDDNTRLLLALKPHLSQERRKKVDKAISLMKIIKLLPILKENGLMNILGV